ncbi:unnamed protein product [Symbiodinium sp. CCMP2592]|nr:unnamed protein product [Symbiodinium sp. CCMP2592]
MTDNRDSVSVPSWDGAARGWRRYTREVSWWVQATPIGKRRYCASKLISKLTGPARLLAMSWSVSKGTFDDPDGTRLLLQRLSASPLVRKTLPNAAAICQQYFSFKRSPQESIGNFLVRETLVHEEFVEAIIRLHEEKLGISQEQRDFGLPDSVEEETWLPWWEWPAEADDEGPGSPPDDGATADAGTTTTPTAAAPTRATPGSSPSHRGDGAAEAVDEKKSSVADGAIDELSVADSFIMGVLRGWRLLQAAGLTAEEKRDILSTTKNSLDYDTVASALQSLWDEQLLGHRGTSGTSGFHLNHVGQEDHHDGYYGHLDEGEDWSWNQPEDDGWYDTYYSHEDPSWWGWDEDGHVEPSNNLAEAETEDPALKEAQQAEQVAEALAMEAQRTWSQAQKATQALRKDRGFGAVTGRPQPNDGRCFSCGGPHLLRDCPDLRFRKGKGKKGYWSEIDDYYANYTGFGKSKGKGKSKKGHWMDVQGLWKGKGKGPKGKTKDGYRTVNAYSSEMFLGGLEVIHNMDLAASSIPTTSSTEPQLGMLDCGATASAAPEAVVKGLISSVLSIDRGARIDIDQYSQPFFRFGNGKWGKALCRVHISSTSSGRERQFSLYTLPNPAEYFQSKLDKASLVPVLIGMDFLGPRGQGMMIDFNTGLAMFTKTSEPRPPVQQLQMTSKGHYVLNLATYLTGGRESPGHPQVVVRKKTTFSPDVDYKFLELGTVYFDMSASDHVMPIMTAVSSDSMSESLANMYRLLDHSRQLVMSSPRVPTTQEEIFVAEIKQKTPKAKAKALPLDYARRVKGDNRDPRASSSQWPCFNRHVADYPKANAHGRWTHCCVCNLRLEYVPRQGSHGQTTQNQNPAMVKRMLTQLEPLMGKTKPTAAICLAMQRKIDAEEQLMHMINEQKTNPTFTTAPAPQTGSPGESSNSSWQMTGDTEDTNLAMAYEADGYQGQQ